MGGDFMEVHCEAPGDNVDGLRAVVDKVLSLSNNDIDYFADEVLGGWDEGDKRAFVLQTAIEFYNDLSEMPRDMDYLFIGGKRYWLTGGISWGDFPTDSFAKIYFFAELEPNWDSATIGADL